MTGRLTRRQVAQVKAAARDGASLRVIARAYGISVSTVHRIKLGTRYATIAAVDTPRPIPNMTPRGVDAEDVMILRKRGLSIPQVARHLGVSERTVYRAATRQQ